MKFFAATAVFLLTVLSVVFLMIKMAGTGMPQHPLDHEKQRIEMVDEFSKEDIERKNQIELEDYRHYFELPSSEEFEDRG